MLRYIQNLCNIHKNIVYEVSEGMQGMSWMTSKECTIIKWAIKYVITWTHKAWVKLMHLGTSTISATWSHLAVINHKDKASQFVMWPWIDNRGIVLLV